MNVDSINETSAFASIGVPEQILKAITKMGFTKPTPIQQKAIPVLMQNRDAISLAETGSGKTAAYLIPVLTQILKQPTHRALILVPTRELATQVGDVVKDLSQFLPEIKFTILIGGSPIFRQIKSLQRNPQVIIATPGRLMDHVRQKKFDLQTVNYLVLDEADRMFDMGFAPQVNDIVRRLMTIRQTILFSATFPNEVRSLAERILSKPVQIEVGSQQAPPKEIQQKMISVTASTKNERTLDLINGATGSVIIFARTKNRTDRLARYLEEYGVAVTRIHGNRSQGQRTKSIMGFKSGEFKVMVATDIAARGLDVSDISDVINYDLPMTAEDYVHRIGRTGRAGQSGQALTLVAPEDVNEWNYIARKMGLMPPDSSKGQSKPPQRFGINRSRSNYGSGRSFSGSNGGERNRFQKSSFKEQKSEHPNGDDQNRTSDRPFERSFKSRDDRGRRSFDRNSSSSFGDRRFASNSQPNADVLSGGYQQEDSRSKPRFQDDRNRSFKRSSDNFRSEDNSRSGERSRDGYNSRGPNRGRSKFGNSRGNGRNDNRPNWR